MRMPAPSLLPLLGETGCGYPHTAEQERVLAQGVLRLALARADVGLSALGTQWEIEVLQVKKDWRRVWHPLPHRRARCRVRLSPRLPPTELTLGYAYPEGCSLEEAVAGAQVCEGVETLAGMFAKQRAWADA